MGIIRGKRWRTDREEMLFQQIQDAMNWSPDMSYECEDGKYRDSHGNEYERMTLEEFLKREKIDE